jgi:hypothetical protein
MTKGDTGLKVIGKKIPVARLTLGMTYLRRRSEAQA